MLRPGALHMKSCHDLGLASFAGALAQVQALHGWTLWSKVIPVVLRPAALRAALGRAVLGMAEDGVRTGGKGGTFGQLYSYKMSMWTNLTKNKFLEPKRSLPKCAIIRHLLRDFEVHHCYDVGGCPSWETS